MADTWEDFYGFKTGYEGKSEDGTNIWEASGDFGIGFGGGDLRRGFNSGYTATEMLKYLGDQNYEAKGVIPQDIKNRLRQSMSIEGALSKGFEKYQALEKSLEGYAKKTDMPDLSGYAKSGDVEDLTTQQSANSLAIAANKAAANNAMTEAQKVKTPFAVTGNTAMQIQGAPSSNQLAGQIATGLGGLSRGNYKLKNKTLNV